jgi:hypothetical protein
MKIDPLRAARLATARELRVRVRIDAPILHGSAFRVILGLVRPVQEEP